MDWSECGKKRIVKSVSKDEELISSLKKTSENKLSTSNNIKLNEITVNSIISLAYDSLRELLEALSLSHNYKIYNHECYTAFLKEILNENQKAEEFDELRTIRNDINYYGREISAKDAEDILERITNLRGKISELLESS